MTSNFTQTQEKYKCLKQLKDFSERLEERSSITIGLQEDINEFSENIACVEMEDKTDESSSSEDEYDRDDDEILYDDDVDESSESEDSDFEYDHVEKSDESNYSDSEDDSKPVCQCASN